MNRHKQVKQGHRGARALMLLLVLVLAIGGTPLSAMADNNQAGGTEPISSQYLTINGEQAAWELTGDKPATLGDTNNKSFNYWDGAEKEFTLTAKLTDLSPGNYTFSLKVYGENGKSTLDGSLFGVNSLVEGVQKLHSTPLDFEGSSWGESEHNWNVIKLDNVIVGEDGLAEVVVRIQSPAGGWGHLGAITYEKDAVEGTVNKVIVSPSSINLRPDSTVQLKVATLPEAVAETAFTYSSSDEKVLTVSAEGLVTAVGNGNASVVVTATDGGGAKGTTKITVSDSWQKELLTQEINVKPVPQLQDGKRSDFIMGADISTIYEIEKSGRSYYDRNGVEKSAMEILKDNGVNWIRLRVWNDPSDGKGNWYGAGNTDKERVVAMSKQAKDLGLNVLVDFHYSDFWADPARQNMPKAWVGLNAEQLEKAVYDYTYEVASALADAGAYPEMMQIGNEINDGLIWPAGRTPEKAKAYLAQGVQAVRDLEKNKNLDRAKLMIHRASPEHGLERLTDFFGTYSDLDYDVIGLSYYPFWHGNFENLQNVMTGLSKPVEQGGQDKEVVVVETSYAFTFEEDAKNGTGHVFGSKSLEEIGGYKVTLAGQAAAMRDVIATVAAVPNDKGLGVFYWEPAWLPGVDTGWATVVGAAYSGEPISSDGGSSWSNQGMFNFFGEAIPSIEVWNKVRGSDADYVAPAIVEVEPVTVVTSEGVEVALPNKVRALFADSAYRNIPVVSWTPAKYDFEKKGTYSAEGTLEDGSKVKASITVNPRNYVKNPSLESSTDTSWEFSGGASRRAENPKSGEYAIHFWDKELVTAKQVVTDLPNGIYQLSMWSKMGGEEIDESYMYAKAGEKEQTLKLSMSGWSEFHHNVLSDIKVTDGKLEIGVVIKQAQNAGGSFDDWDLIKVSDLPGESGGGISVVVPPVTQEPTDKLTLRAIDQVQHTGLGVKVAAPDFAKLEQALQKHENVTIVADSVSADKQLYIKLPVSSKASKGNYIIQTKQGVVSIPVNLLQGSAWQEGKELILRLAEEKVSAGGEELTAVRVELLVDGKTIAWSNPDKQLNVTLPLPEKEAAKATHSVVVKLGEQDEWFAVPHARVNKTTSAAAKTIGFHSHQTGVFAVAQRTAAFTDLSKHAWAGEAIEALAAAGVVQGVGMEQFAPEQAITRADYLVMLVRALGLSTSQSAVFADVAADAYYADAVRIAKVLGISNGTGQDNFSPAQQITREEMMVMTVRAWQSAGLVAADRVSQGANALQAYEDAGSVASFAKESLGWLVQEKAVQGHAGRLHPQDTANRAEAAVLLARLLNN